MNPGANRPGDSSRTWRPSQPGQGPGWWSGTPDTTESPPEPGRFAGTAGARRDHTATGGPCGPRAVPPDNSRKRGEEPPPVFEKDGAVFGKYVLIEKIGDELTIDVSSGDEDVSVRIPLEAAESILESCRGGRVRVDGVLEALSSSASLAGTDLVHVKSDDEEVKVWVW